MKRQQLYIITESGSTAPCKIGISRDPLRRLKQLQTGNYRDLEMPHVIAMPANISARQLETALHRHFDDAKIPGGGEEWFRVSAAAALDIAERMAGLAPVPWWQYWLIGWRGVAVGFLSTAAAGAIVLFFVAG